MDLLEDLQVQHKTLKINHTLNTRCYSVHLKHNNYTSVFSCSLRENLPGNAHTQADLSLRKTKLNISLPYPIFEPFNCDFQTDPCQQLVQEKAEFKRRLEAYCRAHSKEKRKLRWSHIKPQKAATKLELPQYLVDLTLNGDKNPWFDGKYDWFYTGGNLEVVEIEDNPFLISTQGSKLFATHLDNFSKQKLQISRIQAPIYNIKSYYVDNLPYLSIRTKNNIKVVQFEFQNEGNFDIATSVVYEYSAEHRNSPPFIDAHLFDNNKLITADVAYAVQIHDIEVSTVSHQRNFESTTGEFGNLCQLESVSNCLLFMACESLSMLDFRTSSEENQRKKTFKEGYFKCDDLCTICMSAASDNFVYVASRHNVYKCDLREMEVVKKWAHMLDNSPIKIKAMMANQNGDEYVFVASFDETICVHVSTHNNHMPFKLHAITATFNKLRMDNEFILREDVERRFQLSTAGLATFDSSVFVGNAIGDVFKHDIILNSMAGDYEIHILKKLKEYIDAWPSKPRQLLVTHFKEMSDLKEKLIAKPTMAKEEEGLREYKAVNKRRKKFLNPNEKFGMYDMAMIWQSERVPLDDSGSDAVQKERIDTWLAQSVVEKYDPLEEDVDFMDI